MPAKIKASAKPFPIVAIGASAGGLEAVTQLLQQVPPDTGMAFIYIQHLGASQESALPEILKKVTKMKVLEAGHQLPVQKNHVYVIPSDKDITIEDGKIIQRERKMRHGIHMPVDEFFISLAEDKKSAAIGVVLSGNASDGTLGLKAINAAGGLTFAQDESAKFTGMPKSAVAEGVVDRVLSPRDIARELVQVSKSSHIIKVAMQDTEDSISNDDEDLTAVIQLLKKSVGVDFRHYKMNTIKRRIVRRMLLYKLESLKDYTQYLRQHANEINVLYEDLLINVTSFFRDPETMEYLKKKVLPDIIKSKHGNDPIRIWVPACSTGEEAYSLAITLVEILGDRSANTAIQLFATDLSDTAIAKARLGIYSMHEMVNISPKRLQRFFSKTDGHYRIVKSIRDLCIFAPQNIFRDPPFSRLDLISCCNLMIYLDTVLQKKILATFHYALNPDGYLVLGKSETTGSSMHLFQQLDKKYKVYSRKKDAVVRAMFDMNYRLPDDEKTYGGFSPSVKPKDAGNSPNLEKTLDTLLLSKYIPPCVLVNYDLEIILSKGATSLFLELPAGKASLNLLKMARPGLAFELRNLIHKSSKTGKVIKKTGLEIRHNDSVRAVSFEVTPLRSDGDETLFLVVFEEVTGPALPAGKASFSKDTLVKQLQDELTGLREDMRSIVEEHEASVEELQSANEEIVSSNEELQSINEELETSKEEVESTNEELMTINTELQVRNEQLAESYEYAEAVFSTIREAVLVLDDDLRVRSANKSFYRIFKCKEDDVEGVLIYEMLDRQWDIPRLRMLLEEVIPKNAYLNAFEVKHVFAEAGEKILLLNARRVIQKIHRQQLILLAIEDVTEQTQTQQLLAEREAWFRNMADNAPVMIWVAGPNKQFNFVNQTWLEFTGHTARDEYGYGWKKGIHPEDMDAVVLQYNAQMDEKSPFTMEYRMTRHDGEYRWVVNIGKPTYSTEGKFTGYIGSCTDIHDKKMLHADLEDLVQQRTKKLEEINRELKRSNDELKQFAFVASHDLQEPLRKIMTFADRLQKMMTELPENGKIYLDKISSSSQRMTALIDDLLNFSSISRANKKFSKVELDKVLKKVLLDFEVILGEKKGKVETTKLPAMEVIPLQIEQLFHNLVSNALKFVKQGEPPVINISCRVLPKSDLAIYPQLKKADTYYEIVFKDNGIGFDPEFQDQIFVIFQRLNDRQRFPGTGIGLALCRKIVDNHEGLIYAKSEENEGAEFHIILPAEQT